MPVFRLHLSLAHERSRFAPILIIIIYLLSSTSSCSFVTIIPLSHKYLSIQIGLNPCFVLSLSSLPHLFYIRMMIFLLTFRTNQSLHTPITNLTPPPNRPRVSPSSTTRSRNNKRKGVWIGADEDPKEALARSLPLVERNEETRGGGGGVGIGMYVCRYLVTKRKSMGFQSL